MRRHGGAVRSEIADAPRARGEIAADDLEQGRFAGAIGADQPYDLAFADRERHVAQRHHAAEVAGDAFHLERSRRHRGPPETAFLNTSPTIPLEIGRASVKERV